MEVHANFAQNAIVGFARLHGQVVGIVGQQPLVLSGAIDINAADKMAASFASAMHSIFH